MVGRERSAAGKDKRGTGAEPKGAALRVGATARDPAAVGNQALLALLRASQSNAGLMVSQPGDADEREADRVAADVMRPGPAVQVAAGGGAGVHRMCLDCEAERHVQAKADGRGATMPAGGLVSGGGHALDAGPRGFFESRLGADLGSVRVHADGPAAASAQAIGARAFTVGEHVSFGAGQYAPGSEAGRHLLAHELAHVVQQRRGAGGVQRSPADAPAAAPVLVDDEATAGPGQMRRRDFLAALRDGVCATVDQALAGTPFSSSGCPYIAHWLAYYESCDVAHAEAALRRYAGGSAPTATAYIPIVCARVRRSAIEWARTGRVTGLPEGAGALPPAGGAQLKALDGGGAAPDHPMQIRAELGQGRPLEGNVRGRMESALASSFSDVRVHSDGAAAALSSRYHARAFTVGSDVAFGAGEYQPGGPVGDALIAHELAHVIQQRGGGPVAMGKTQADASPLEADADAAAVGAFSALYLGDRQAAAALGAQAQPQLRSGLRLQRCGGKPKPPPWAPPTGRTTSTFDAPQSPFGRFTFEHGLDTAPSPSAAGSYYEKTTLTPNARTSNAAAIGFQQIYRRGSTPGSWWRNPTDPMMDPVRTAITDPTTGFAIDQPFYSATFENTPYYALTKSGAGYSERSIVHQGRVGGDDAWMWDTPGVGDPYAIEFYSCAVCTQPVAAAPSEKDRSYGCISWGFTYASSSRTWNEETPAFSIQSAFGAQTGRAAGLESALTRWGTNVATAGSGIETAAMPFQRGATVKAAVGGGFARLRTVNPATGNLVRSATTLGPGTQLTVLQQRVVKADVDGRPKAMTEVQVTGGDVGWVLAGDLDFTHV